LLAPVRVAGIVGGRENAARSEGVILDDAERVVAFIVRISRSLVPGGPRTLVPVSAMRPTEESGLELSWSEDKLLEHPRLDEPNTDTVTDHEGGDATPALTVNGAALGTAIGVGFGAIAAFAFPPIGVLAMAAFFGFGGLLVGATAGAAQDAIAKEGEALEEHSSKFAALEQALRDPTLVGAGLVHVTSFEDGPAPAEVARTGSDTLRRRNDVRAGMSDRR
jgi:hypothetical protein